MDIKQENDESNDFGGLNTTASSCDYSLSQFKDEPLSELPPEEESEEDSPSVNITFKKIYLKVPMFYNRKCISVLFDIVRAH